MNTLAEPVIQSLSLSHGAPLEADPRLLVDLAATLRRAAEQSPQKGVRYLKSDGSDRLQPYPALLMEASRFLTGLRRAGLKPGDKLLFQLHQNEDFVPAFWGCMMGGFVPVPISIPPSYDEAHNTLAKLQNAWVLLDRPMVLAGDELRPGLERFAQRQGMAGFQTLSAANLRGENPSSDWHPNQPEDLAVLLLTSGSTGRPKGVQLNHRNILSRSAATAQLDQFGAHDVSLNWMPLDHVGGLVMFHIRDVYLACDQIQAPTDLVLANPLTWLQWIAKYRVTITWAPNFAFGVVNDQAEVLAQGNWDLSSLRFILNGGEAIVSKTARRFLSLLAPHALPSTAMKPAWGMSETSSGVTSSHLFSLSSTSDADPFVEVGGPIPGTSLRIVDRRNQPVPEGKIGALQIKGLSITRGYYQNPELNAEVFTDDGWFVTGDLGFLKDGRLTITGREKDVIIVNGVNFHSHEIEAVVEEVNGVEVSFTAACAVRLPGENTDRVAIFFTPTSSASGQIPELIKAIRAAVVKQEAVNPDYVIPVTKESIPKTAIGKIQRSQLKQQFERGDYMDLVQKYAQGSEGGAPDWFYRPAWCAAPLSSAKLSAGASVWIFATRNASTERLWSQLVAAGQRCTWIEPGLDFERVDEKTLRLSPGNPQHYARLVETLSVPDLIIHTWTYGCESREPANVGDLEAAQANGAYSLLGLVKALVPKNSSEQTVRMLVVSSQTRATHERDAVTYAKTPILGLVRTIPQEVAWLDCHHVDLEGRGVEKETEQILRELSAWDGATESAWRGDERLIPCLEKAPLAEEPRPLPFKKGGFYLLSGGIGGIGLRFAGHLLQHFNARLLIVGRSVLPPRSEWKSVLATQQGKRAERVRALEALEVQGGEVEYVAVDVADQEAMARAVENAEKKWSRPLDGVLHLAGIYHESLLEKETIAGLAAVMRPKVSGAWVLHQVAKERKGCLFINFSSLISHFGSLSTGAYAAANNFLDGFSHYQRRSGGLQTYNLLWSSWTDIGMSRGYDAGEALRSRGYLSISAEQGVASLLFALRHDHPQLLIGVDGTNKGIQRYFHPETVAATTIPVTEPNGYVAPRNEIERQIAKVWEEILSVPRIGIKDNFFELGGRSLLAAKMFAKINKTLGKNLPIPALFKAPTIEQLAIVFLEQTKSSAVKIEVLQAGGSGAPVFLMTDASPDANGFSELVRQFGEQRPSFVFRAQAMMSAVPRPVDLEELARLFADEITILHPRGRCALGGRGFGAVVAWMTAQALAQRGRATDIAVFFALEPSPPAFFAKDTSGYRFVKPAAPGGLLGRLFRKGSEDDAAVTKELRQQRERYGDTTLAPADWPIVVSADRPSAPWNDLSKRSTKRVSASELGAELSRVLSS